MSKAFVSVLDLLEEDPSGRGLRAVQDEVLEMDLSVKRYMDTGLTSDEMVVARRVREATQAAGRALDKIVR